MEFSDASRWKINNIFGISPPCRCPREIQATLDASPPLAWCFSLPKHKTAILDKRLRGWGWTSESNVRISDHNERLTIFFILLRLRVLFPFKREHVTVGRLVDCIKGRRRTSLKGEIFTVLTNQDRWALATCLLHFRKLKPSVLTIYKLRAVLKGRKHRETLQGSNNCPR